MKWIAKAAIQAGLALLPGGEHINHQLQRLNAKRRGPSVLQHRLIEINTALSTLKKHHSLDGAVVVEIGTGWDALPTLSLSAQGAKIHTYDHERHLRDELLKSAALAVGHTAAANASDMGEALKVANITYVAPGDASRTGLPDHSVDIFFSLAVLEHIPREALGFILHEARRVLKPEGVFYALIGLHDHFNGFDRRVSKINFLRYPEWQWAILSNNRIAYHNRLRHSDFLGIFKTSGAEVIDTVTTVDPDDLALVKTMKLAPQFQGYDPHDLATTQSEVILRFKS